LTKILCVEDEVGLRSDIVEELQDAGYETLESDNGEEGLKTILEDRPDLVLCDITMPGMSGHQLLTTLRENHPQFSTVPFLFLSALADRNDIVVGKDLGADDYLTKPVDYDILLATVRSRLEQVERMDGQKAVEMNALRESVLRMLPHELRTPLNHILGYSSLLSDEIFGPLGNEKYKDYADQIHQGGTRLLTIVEDALVLLNISVGEMKPTLGPCNVAEIVGASISDMRADAEQKHVDFQVDVESAPSKFVTDPELLKRAFDAILSNAIKYTGENGQVQVSATSDEDGGLLLKIADTGIGIAQDQIAQVMKPFEQAQTGLDRSHEGIGLGLPMAKATTEVLGGRFDLQSEVDTGSAVTMTFPAVGISAKLKDEA